MADQASTDGGDAPSDPFPESAFTTQVFPQGAGGEPPPAPATNSAYAAYEAGRSVAPEVLESPGALVDPRIRRRRRRQTITFALFFLLVAGLGLGAYAAYQGRIDLPIGSGRPAPLPTCPPSPAPTALAFADTSVNVFNASSRRGLALTVARDLQRRGFKVPAQPANDPLKTKVATAAVIRHGPSGLLAARTVASVVDGPVTLVSDERPTDDVDLVLGATFKLRPIPKNAASASAAAPAAAATCTPAPEATPSS